MDINLDILKQIITEKTDALKKMDLDDYSWKERIQKSDLDLEKIDDEQDDEQKKLLLKAILSYMQRNKEVINKETIWPNTNIRP